jgi:hypothetical protein
MCAVDAGPQVIDSANVRNYGEPQALAAMVTYLAMNRMTWECGEVEETAMVLRAAAGHMSEREWEAWVVGNVGKKG